MEYLQKRLRDEVFFFFYDVKSGADFFYDCCKMRWGMVPGVIYCGHFHTMDGQGLGSNIFCQLFEFISGKYFDYLHFFLIAMYNAHYVCI